MITHFDVAQKIAAIVRDMDCCKSGSVQICDFPFSAEPPGTGLILSPLVEREVDGLNESTDVAFPCQIMRCGHRVNSQDGLKSRSHWRRSLFKRFRRTKIGVVDPASGGTDCELYTYATPDDIQLPKEWEKWNLDASVLIITTVVRGIDDLRR